MSELGPEFEQQPRIREIDPARLSRTASDLLKLQDALLRKVYGDELDVIYDLQGLSYQLFDQPSGSHALKVAFRPAEVQQYQSTFEPEPPLQPAAQFATHERQSIQLVSLFAGAHAGYRINEVLPDGLELRGWEIIGEGHSELQPVLKARDSDGDLAIEKYIGQFCAETGEEIAISQLLKIEPTDIASFHYFIAATPQIADSIFEVCEFTNGPDEMIAWLKSVDTH